MAEDDKKGRWQFTKEQLANSPSRAHGVDASKELSYRQQTANFIQDIGRHLNVTQLVINTAIVYMHRFFMHHSFKIYHRNNVAAAFLFLACKIEEQPRKLEHVVTVAYACLHRGEAPIDTSTEDYKRLSDEVIKHELLVLQTLGFDVQIRHPHPDVVKCTQLVRASKDLAQTAYFMAHNSLLLTTMCLEHKPSVVACVCIHLACQWKGVEIPSSSDNQQWWSYVDKNITLSLLDELAQEFVGIYESCPSRFRAKIDSKQQSTHGSDKSSKRPDKFFTQPKHATPKSDSTAKEAITASGHLSSKHNLSAPSTSKQLLDTKHSHQQQQPQHSGHKPPSHKPHSRTSVPTGQQLPAIIGTNNPLPKLPMASHEVVGEQGNHRKAVDSSAVVVEDGATNSMSLEAYKQKRAKQVELQQHQQLQHKHSSKRPPPQVTDEVRAKKVKREYASAQLKKEHHNKQRHLKQQPPLVPSSMKHLPPLPPAHVGGGDPPAPTR